MSQDRPQSPSPDAPPPHNIQPDLLHLSLDAMYVDPSSVPPNNFSDEWGSVDTEEALALSSVDNARLKDCIIAASALVWGVLLMHPAQLKTCYRLLHHHLPNLLVVVHRTGRGKTHILCMLGVIERGIVLIFIPQCCLPTSCTNLKEPFQYGEMWVSTTLMRSLTAIDQPTLHYFVAVHQ